MYREYISRGEPGRPTGRLELMNVDLTAIPDKPILCASFRGPLTVSTMSSALAEIDRSMDSNPVEWLIFRTHKVDSISQPAATQLLEWIISSAKAGRLRGTGYCSNSDATTGPSATGSRPDVYRKMLEICDQCKMMNVAPTVAGVLRSIAYCYTDDGEQLMPGDMYKGLGTDDRIVEVPLGEEMAQIVNELASTVSRNTTRRRAPKSA
jgi:hypothetical protein